jgi:hypothetical protein
MIGFLPFIKNRSYSSIEQQFLAYAHQCWMLRNPYDELLPIGMFRDPQGDKGHGLRRDKLIHFATTFLDAKFETIDYS